MTERAKTRDGRPFSVSTEAHSREEALLLQTDRATRYARQLRVKL